jgi:hypothetical protein
MSSCVGAAQTVSAYPVLAGRRARCTRLGRRSLGATTAPKGEDHVKVQASLGCKRNVLRPLVQLGLLGTIQCAILRLRRGCARQRGFQALLHPRLARSLEGRRGSIAPVLPKIHGVGLHVHRARATMPRGLLT